ncbi:PREDICTED: neuroglobin-like [Amphimedon queenslandica]|uniref:Globin domain-containing protein n=1 Tax=Amphimedon queenslandica TaxID=400682 RepID=A0A1X7UGV4_AMPQE|nr:PREDICTED: neuroglobin-like [Amphimedon queenslandica]|eukprot:XP_003387899.1 PREDICTED: neuroglobin-like [Amphimedon queenslandica]
MSLTSAQVALIESTWKVVKKDLQGAGNIMFLKLFQIDVSVRDKFPFRDVPYEELEDSESFLKHSLQVMETIDLAITLLLGGEMEKLVEALVDLGMAHAMQGLKPEDFDHVGEALVHALGVALGKEFNDEAKKAWTLLYSVVTAKMKEGLKEAQED